MVKKNSKKIVQEETARDKQPQHDGVMVEPGTDNSIHTTLVQRAATHEEWQPLSTYTELIAVADEWIAAASDEQEQAALLATKEDLLQAMNRMRANKRSS